MLGKFLHAIGALEQALMQSNKKEARTLRKQLAVLTRYTELYQLVVGNHTLAPLPAGRLCLCTRTASASSTRCPRREPCRCRTTSSATPCCASWSRSCL